MGKKQKAPEEQTSTNPSRRPPGWLIAVGTGLLACSAGAAATYALARQPQPLGIPIPRPPQPLFHIDKVATASSSVLKHQLPAGWLADLAPQPDGTPYLSQYYQSEKLGFTIRYPFGAENIQFGIDTFLQDSVESQAIVRVDQALAAIKVSLPSAAGKKQLEFGRHLLADAIKRGATQIEAPRAVQLPAGGFVTLAYRRHDSDANYVHRLYLAGVSKRALIFDFMLRPETVELGERYVQKIMGTLDPGPQLGPALEVRAPQKKVETKQGTAGIPPTTSNIPDAATN